MSVENVEQPSKMLLICKKKTFWDIKQNNIRKNFKLEKEHWYLEKDREIEIG